MSEKSLSVEQALRKAETLARNGQNEPARQLCTAILAKFPANKRTMAVLKALPVQRPQRAPAADGVNELIALYNQRRLQEVLDRGSVLARQHPDNPMVPNLLGAAYAALERYDDAIASFTDALAIDPGIFLAHSNMGAAHAAVGRHGEAVECYSRALEINPGYAIAHNNLGNALRKLGRLDEAAASYARALEIKPDFAEAQGSLGVTLREMDRPEEAAGQLAQALELDPDNAEMHNSLGVALINIGRHDQAIASYRAALRVKPDLTEAFNNLCELLEKTHQIDDLRQTVSEAQANFGGDDAQLHYWLAEIASRDGRHEDARDHLAAILQHQLPQNLWLKRSALLSKTYDRLGQFDLAFRQFCETNQLAADREKFRNYNAVSYFDEILGLKNAWSEVRNVDWPPAAPDGPSVSLAFMVGFPRSGTTLLDTVLRSHPKIIVVEEGPMVDRAKTGLGQPPTYAALGALDAGGVQRLRAAYLDELRRHVGDVPDDCLVIDKLPLNLINAGLIHRMFPEAKFIMALRHPCDCVLSCFIQNFQLNDAMANFLDLEQAARLYDLTMTLWQQYQQKLGLAVGYLKYEDLVLDLRSAAEPLLGFLGLEWDENLMNYQETALSRGRINTPSYNQVTQKLYTQASGRWQNYRGQMAPVLPILEPWVAEWGYAT